MTINDLEISKVTRTTFSSEPEKTVEILGIECNVVIVRDGVTYSVPYNKSLEMPTEHYDTDMVETFMMGFILECNKINERWQLVVEEEAPVAFTGKVISQRPFDIIKDI